MKYFIFYLLLISGIGLGYSQNSITMNAQLNDSLRTFDIQQEIIYKNESKDTLREIYLNDWANAYSSKSTPLAQRFAEEFSRRFHFSKEIERGGTSINTLSQKSGDPLSWSRPEQHPDIIRVELPQALPPGEKFEIHLDYKLKIPSDKFTRYGVDNVGNYKLRYWYINLAVYRDGWQFYSHHNLDNQFTSPADISITLSIPKDLYIASALAKRNSQTSEDVKTVELVGLNRTESKLYLTRSYLFESQYAQSHEILTDVEADGLQPAVKRAILDRIIKFIYQRLGTYPHSTLFVTQEDYLDSPIYGLNQLPSFIRPFPDGFQYDIKQVKTITNNLLKNSIRVNPREEQWVKDAILVALMMDYVDMYYPRMKLIGNLSDIIGIRWFHAADLEFNDQYQFLHMNTARLNLDQALTTSQDSLIKFNINIANPYKAGVGIKYLENYLDSNAIKNSIRKFYKENSMEPVSAEDFESYLKEGADKDISWFFDQYVAKNEKIDFRISELVKTKDSLKVTVLNKRSNGFPVSLYGLKDGQIIYKTWVDDFKQKKTVSIPRQDIERLALNYEGIIPEINQRDNYKRVSALFNKPLQFRLLQDIEDPRYSQVFFMPEFDYNLYDGVSIGPKMYNKTFLNKNFQYSISPKYGYKSKTLVGSASLLYNQQFENKELHSIRYGLSGSRFSYNYGLFYEKYTPFIGFYFRNKNLRNNERQRLLIRNVNVRRDKNPAVPLTRPDYNVFNINYQYSKPHLVDFHGASFDYQLAEKFSKVSMSLEYRKLFKSNRQINLRFFAGAFLYNDSQKTDYFSFALDRPTDYLFDYNYYGRSQGSGLFSQQIIVAEGGFKSQLQPEYANQWLTTINGSTNLWKFIFVYADAGLVKNQFESAKFLYDSGLRLSLVDDYFEVFFPVYSSLGWEVGKEKYDQRIRFIVSLDINTLIKLFTRRWY